MSYQLYAFFFLHLIFSIRFTQPYLIYLKRGKAWEGGEAELKIQLIQK